MLRLELHIAVLREPKPLHIGKDRFDMLGPTACPVNVLDPKAKLTTKSARKFMRTQRRKGVPQMQLSIGTRGKSGDHRTPWFYDLAQIGINEVKCRQKIIPNYTTFSGFTLLTSPYV
jgi:hypothetical protein